VCILSHAQAMMKVVKAVIGHQSIVTLTLRENLMSRRTCETLAELLEHPRVSCAHRR
jgi:hypothetical protein